MKKPVRLVRRPTPNGDETKRALTLHPSVSLSNHYVRQWVALVEQMYPKVRTAVLAEYGNTAAADATPGFWDKLLNGITDAFVKAAPGLATGMLKRVDTNAAGNLSRSLLDVSDDFTLKMGNTPAVAAALAERVKKNVFYITRIPELFLDDLQKKVNLAVTEGRGLDDITKLMEDRYGEAKRHARNVALDQTRKAYTALNTVRMKDNGVTKFEWVHTGGSQDPREYHLRSHSAGGLNGGIFSVNDPPIMDLKSGRRGLPGDDYFCRCTMRPIVSFDDDDDDDEDS